MPHSLALQATAPNAARSVHRRRKECRPRATPLPTHPQPSIVEAGRRPEGQPREPRGPARSFASPVPRALARDNTPRVLARHNLERVKRFELSTLTLAT